MMLYIFFGQDSDFYNMDIVTTYVFILFIAFIICIYFSNKFNVYRPKVNRGVIDDFEIFNGSSHHIQQHIFDEVAVALEDIRGVEDER